MTDSYKPFKGSSFLGTLKSTLVTLRNGIIPVRDEYRKTLEEFKNLQKQMNQHCNATTSVTGPRSVRGIVNLQGGKVKNV